MSADEPNNRAEVLRRRRLIAGGVASAIAIGIGFAMWWNSRSDPEPNRPAIPEIATNGVHRDVAEAIEEARRRVESKPDSGIAWGRYGIVLKAHEYNAEAVICFRIASDLSPATPDWPYLLGDTLESQDESGAIAAYREAFRRKPADALPLLRVAQLHLRTGDVERASTVLDEARQVSHQKNPRLDYLQGRCHAARGEWTKAWTLVERARAAAGDHPQVLDLYAQVAERLKKKEAALKAAQASRGSVDYVRGWPDSYLEAVAATRRDPRWYAFRARQLRDVGREREGVAMITRGWERYPTSLLLLTQHVKNHLRAGDYANADRLLKSAEANHRDAPDILRLRGSLEVLRKNWPAASKAFQQLVAIRPQDSSAHTDLGFCLSRLNKPDEAIRAFERALQIRPNMTATRIHLARLFIKQNRTAEARRQLNAVPSTSPDYAAAKTLLKSLNK